MTPAKISTLLELIEDLVREDGSWAEKRDAILKHASDDDRMHLEEFSTWFEPAE